MQRFPNPIAGNLPTPLMAASGDATSSVADDLGKRYAPTSDAQLHQRWLLLGLIVLLLAIAVVYTRRKRSRSGD